MELQYSKLDLEGVPMEMRSIRLDEFVTGFVDEAAPDSRTHGMEITVEQLAPVVLQMPWLELFPVL